MNDLVQKANRQENTQKLNALVNADNQALFTFQTVFPFDLFPDRISIDRNKITITKRYFFFDRAVQSILIKDLMTVIGEESLLFATLHIVDRLLPNKTITVMNLPKSDARTARRILEGLLISEKKGVDLTTIPNSELVPKLIEIGKTTISV